MFNMSGSEVIVILLLALVVLGPEKLPDAMRRAGKAVAELRRLGSSFQSEMHETMDEPMREMRETANLLRGATDFRGTARRAVTGATTTTPASTASASLDAAGAANTDADAATASSPSANGDPGRRPTTSATDPASTAASTPAAESSIERALRGESTIDRAAVGEDGTAPA